MGTKLYVGNLLYETTEDELKDFFSQVGSVISTQIIRYRDGKSKGFGFVEMSTPEEMNAAVERFNGQDFKGRRVVVAEARPPRPRDDRVERPSMSSPMPADDTSAIDSSSDIVSEISNE